MPAPLAASPGVSAPAPDALTRRALFFFFLPLAVSFLFMAVEGPISMIILNRSADAVLAVNAFAMVLVLAIWIEGPVIDLLSTATAKARNRQHVQTLQTFALLVMAGVTVVHGLVGFTPLWWWVTEGLLGAKRDVAEAGRLPFQIMLFWSAVIGWRRYRQGVVIRHGETRVVGIGTLIRMVTLITTGFCLFGLTELPGALVVAWAFVASVTVESCFIHFATRGVIQTRITDARPDEGRAPLSLRDLTAFHTPLALSTVVMLAAPNLVIAAINRMPEPLLGVSGWQAALTVLFLFRTAAFALPEVVIARYRDAESRVILRRFCIEVGLATSALALLFWATPASNWFFNVVYSVEPEVLPVAQLALLAGCFMPFINSIQGYVRGVLTSHNLTGARLWAILVGVIVLVVSLTFGARLALPSVLVAGLGLFVGSLAELVVLVAFWRKSARGKMAGAPA